MLGAWGLTRGDDPGPPPPVAKAPPRVAVDREALLVDARRLMRDPSAHGLYADFTLFTNIAPPWPKEYRRLEQLEGVALRSLELIEVDVTRWFTLVWHDRSTVSVFLAQDGDLPQAIALLGSDARPSRVLTGVWNVRVGDDAYPPRALEPEHAFPRPVRARLFDVGCWLPSPPPRTHPAFGPAFVAR